MRIDPALVTACQRGEPDALDALIRGSYTEVYALCRRMLSTDVDAADATQEVFIKVCRSVLGFRGQAAFGTWLHRVTVNVCLDALRRRGALRTGTAPWDEDYPLADPHAGPADVAADHDLGARTAAAVATLPAAQRAVVVLRDVEGLSTAEVAALLGVTEDVVRVRLHRAHARLRGLLSAAGISPAVAG